MTLEELEKEVSSYMTSCYGPAWVLELKLQQQKEIIQAFLSGMIIGMKVVGFTDVILTSATIKIYLQKIGSL